MRLMKKQRTSKISFFLEKAFKKPCVNPAYFPEEKAWTITKQIRMHRYLLPKAWI